MVISKILNTDFCGSFYAVKNSRHPANEGVIILKIFLKNRNMKSLKDVIILQF